ncbi:MAG: hydroxyacid aldolase, partial [Hyphomicrobiales bacterium]|nr:hydroxyacid aldolase [Hyphomicrobiales bacterium]
MDGGLIGTLAARIASGDCAFAGWVGIPDPMVAETLARTGFDAVVLDMQHGALDVMSAIRGVAACALAGKPAIVRVPVGDFATASRAL